MADISPASQDTLSMGTQSAQSAGPNMSSNLDPRVLNYYRQTYVLFDKDQEGMPATELPYALRLLGFNPTEGELTKIFEASDIGGIVEEGDNNHNNDQNQSGVSNETGNPPKPNMVSFEQFLVCCNCAGTFGLHSSNELKEAFLWFDPDGRGTIGQTELRYILTTMGDKLTREEANELLEWAASDPSNLDENTPPNIDYMNLMEIWKPPIMME